MVDKLAKEATILIFLDEHEKVLNGIYLWVGTMAVPLKVCSEPEDLPASAAFIIGSLGNGMFQYFAFVSPTGTNFKYHDALPFYAIPEIKPSPYGCWWASSFDELGNELFAPFDFEFAECHDEIILSGCNP